MVFYLIGLGLGDAGDITVNGLNIVRSCAKVFLESYTSMLSNGPDLASLEQFYGRPLREADRELVEQRIEQLLEEARTADIALLVVGDPFGATTHADLVLRARELDVPLRVVRVLDSQRVHSDRCWLLWTAAVQFWSDGVHPMWTDGWEPDSFLDKYFF
uniref:diphthine methyl ester synthase n=1 Tax=Globodera pallida TaxID=36090 RepID=A0A183CNY8_GLOPA